ncbi:MAG: HEAT repeat domain-containing protein [Pedobacter sp.]|uniref:HEAT repeat domain-containing protein n=1 Tax=Pedobacter sp. TaxID=1411316 RepID=UPI002809B119|nr:HEAT repeat domain-containing protein [Pedobacter sp.]MDQ8003672.1 HEAT repeat domain-containing protein [Pedobacter sp.]
MERDFFKRYVEEHRDAFENEALPPNMLGNILNKLEERKSVEANLKLEAAPKSRKLTYTWLAVACSLFIVAGAYLFLSQEKNELTATPTQIVSTNNNNVEPAPFSILEEVEPAVKSTNAVKKQRILVAHQPKVDAHKEIYTGLSDSSSVANRMDAIIKASALVVLNEKMKTELCKTFSDDNNDNVRLAALEVLSKFSNDKYIHEQLMAGLSKQKDPIVQLELVKIMGSNSNPETTDKLIAMANNPFTVDAVKEQVHYALLTNNN